MTKTLFHLMLSCSLSVALAVGCVAQGGKPPEKPKDREKIIEKPKPTPTPKKPG